MDLAQTLLNRGLLNEAQLAQSRDADSFLDWLISQPSVDKDKALEAAAEEYGVEYIDIANAEIDLGLLDDFPQKLIYRASLFPITRSNGSIRIATADPLNFYPLDEVAAATGLQVCLLYTLTLPTIYSV